MHACGHSPYSLLYALQGDTGRLHVVDDEGRLLGLVSRTDMLRHFQHYKEMSRRVV